MIELCGPESLARESAVSTEASAHEIACTVKGLLVHSLEEQAGGRSAVRTVGGSAAQEPHYARPILTECSQPTKTIPCPWGRDSALTCTRFQPWRDSAMIDVTDGQTPPNTIKWFGPYFIAS